VSRQLAEGDVNTRLRAINDQDQDEKITQNQDSTITNKSHFDPTQNYETTVNVAILLSVVLARWGGRGGHKLDDNAATKKVSERSERA